MKNNSRRILLWVTDSWFQLSVIVLMVFAIHYFSSILSEIKKEVLDVADGIEVEIVDWVDSPSKLPKLPKL